MSTMLNHNALVLAKADELSIDLDKYKRKAGAQMGLDENDLDEIDLERPWGKGPKPKLSDEEVQRLRIGIHF